MRLRDLGSGVEVEAGADVELPRSLKAVRDGKVAWVHWNGETYRLEAVVRRTGAAEHEGDHGLLAPMPGRVVRLLVAEGQEVAKGAPLLLLEAMKMEHEVRAPKAGRVARLHRQPGEMVALGDPLAELE